MLKLSLIFLAFIALFVLLLRGAVILIGRFAGKYVGEKHKAAETIINTGTPPIAWICNSIKKMAELREDPTGPRAMKIEEKARNSCLKRLEDLIKYFKASPLCQDEETRKILLDELSKVRRVWQEKDWGEIIILLEQETKIQADSRQITLKQKNVALDKKNKIYYYLGKKEKEVRKGKRRDWYKEVE